MATTESNTTDAHNLPNNDLIGRLARCPDGAVGTIVDVEEPGDGHRRVVLDVVDGEYSRNIAAERVEVGQ